MLLPLDANTIAIIKVTSLFKCYAKWYKKRVFANTFTSMLA